MKIRGKKHTFGDTIKALSFDDFKKHCQGLKIFAELPIKERNSKIKEVYGDLNKDANKGKKLKSNKDLHRDDKG